MRKGCEEQERKETERDRDENEKRKVRGTKRRSARSHPFERCNMLEWKISVFFHSGGHGFESHLTFY